MTHTEASRLRRERAKNISLLILKGNSRKQVAAMFGISRQRVQQLIKFAGA